eukprot:Ihof_evm1s643 gene=Ihof_evmTU1s643
MSFQDSRSSNQPIRTSNTVHQDEFTNLSKQVKRNVHEFASGIASLSKLVKKLGSKRDTTDLQHRIRELQESACQLARDTANDIKELAHLEQISPIVDEQRRISQQRLAKDFADLLLRFEKVEQDAAAKERAHVGRARDMQHSNSVLISLEDISANDNDELISDLGAIQSQVQTTFSNEIEYNEQVISERERGILEIESTIAEVNDMFRDIGALVHEQGELLDNIESNIVSAADRVDSGTEDLGRAREHQ